MPADERYAAVHIKHATEHREDLPLAGDDAATLAVNAIFCDLRDRRTLKWIFGPPGSGDQIMPGLERLGDDIQVTIAEQWRETIRQAYAAAQGTTACPQCGRAIYAKPERYAAHGFVAPCGRRLILATELGAHPACKSD